MFLYAPAFSTYSPLSAEHYPVFKYQVIVSLGSLRVVNANHDSSKVIIQRTIEGIQRMIASTRIKENEKKKEKQPQRK